MIEQIKQILGETEFESLKGIRVLFAGNSAQTIDIVKHVIKELGWNAVYVDSALGIMNAVNNIRAEGLTLDGVVTNLQFIAGPRLTGITAIRELRKVLPNVPVIFLSPYVTTMIKEEIRGVGAEIVQKPANIESLFIKLAQLIYWYKLGIIKEYRGLERRHNSVNRGTEYRRSSDYVLATPTKIASILRN